MEDWKLKVKEALGISDEEWEKGMSVSDEEVELRFEKLKSRELRNDELQRLKEENDTKVKRAEK